MPKSPLLPRLIRLVKPNERNRFKKWIEMQTVDLATHHVQWFETVFYRLEELGFPEKIELKDMESWWSIQFPKLPLKNRMMERLNKNLSRMTEDFFAFELQKMYKDRTRVDLTYALLLRGANRLFVKIYNQEIKRYRNRTGIKIDFRFWQNYNQLLNIGRAWKIYSAGHKRVRGFVGASVDEEIRCHRNAIIQFALERGLFKINLLQPLTNFDRKILEEIRTNPDFYSLPTQSLRTVYDWSLMIEIPEEILIRSEIDNLIQATESMSEDFSGNILPIFHNVLANWERRDHRYDLVQQRIRVYKKILEKHARIFTTGHFFVLVNLHSELIGYVNWRTSLNPSASRQTQIQPFLQAAMQDLEEQIQRLPITDQADSINLMNLHLSFEKDEEEKLAVQFRSWFNSPAKNPLYEAGARWLKSKYLFIKGEEDALFSHTRAFEAFLRTNTRPPNSVTYLDHLKVSCRYIRRISSAINQQKSTEKIAKELQQEKFIHDRPWLQAIMLKNQE